MLVLSRKVGEKTMIGGNITVEIVRVAGNRVTLGIEAPPEVRVLREELLELLSGPSEDEAPPSEAA